MSGGVLEQRNKFLAVEDGIGRLDGGPNKVRRGARATRIFPELLVPASESVPALARDFLPAHRCPTIWFNAARISPILVRASVNAAGSHEANAALIGTQPATSIQLPTFKAMELQEPALTASWTTWAKLIPAPGHRGWCYGYVLMTNSERGGNDFHLANTRGRREGSNQL